MLELLSTIAAGAPTRRTRPGELRRILPPDSFADLRSLLMLTWLKHVPTT